MRSSLKKLLIVLLLSNEMISCHSQNCDKLPDEFATYKEAINLVEKSTFKIHQIANTSKDSWITSAQFYSCDGKSGYFIYSTKEGKDYIHKDVPINVWEEFKSAVSKGSYYDYNIKHKYQLILDWN